MENIYEITVRNFPDNRTMVTECLDPMFDAKLLIEGAGVLVKDIVAWSKTHPKELKESNWDLTADDVIKKLQDNLALAAKDYKDITT